MPSAYLQWRFHSGERVVARGPLVKIPGSVPGGLITKTCLYNFDPLKPHFYIHVVKLGFTGVYIIFLISAYRHRLWVLVRTASQRRF